MSAQKLSPDELLALSMAFHELSITIGTYRLDNWDALSPSKCRELESKQWTLFNISSDLNAASVVAKMKLLEDELNLLKVTTNAMSKLAGKIDDTKHAIEIAARAVAFGGAIYVAGVSGDVAPILMTARLLMSEIQGDSDA